MDLAAHGIHSNFTAIDWGIVAAYLCGTIVIGLIANRYISNMADYVVAGRALKSYLGVATLIGTEFGLVSVVCGSQLGFTGGFSAFHVGVLGLIVTLFVGATGVVLVPLRRSGVMTIPEYYEKRFGRKARVLGGLIIVIAGLATMGFFVKAGAIFVAGLTGMTNPMHLKLFMSGMVLLVLIYTGLGGMVSIVIADYVQFVVMSIGLIVVCLLGIYHLGWENIVSTVSAGRGEAGFNPLHKDGFGTAYVLYMALGAFASCALWQTSVIRACAAENTRTVKRIISASSIGFMTRMTIPVFIGVCAYVFISQHESLGQIFLSDAAIADSETTMMASAVYLGQLVPTGLMGLVAAGMLAAFLSTHDSYMLCWSAVFVEDVVAPCAGGKLSTRARLTLSRLFLIGEGVFILVFGLWYPLGQNLWDYMLTSGGVYWFGAAPVLIMGIYWKRASRVGAFLAMVTGFGAFLGLKPVQALIGRLLAKLMVATNCDWLLSSSRMEALKNLELSTPKVSLCVVGLAFALMLIGSLLFPDRHGSPVVEEA
ncbi:MAG: sodium:solute symporter family protein [Pirellulales bacterium]|nr:sodium:solute symporter family protein [Pirellulales bacterium]